MESVSEPCLVIPSGQSLHEPPSRLPEQCLGDDLRNLFGKDEEGWDDSFFSSTSKPSSNGESHSTQTTEATTSLGDENPGGGLGWTKAGPSVKPTWTVDPRVEDIQIVLRNVFPPNTSTSVDFLWNGAWNKFYDITNSGEQYVLKVTLPVCPKLKTESEIATLRWVHDNTNLPVPKVIHYSSNHDNPLGFEWILMDKLKGQPLTECFHDITLDRKRAIVNQLVDYQVQVHQKPFHGGICSLYPPPGRGATLQKTQPPTCNYGHQTFTPLNGPVVSPALYWCQRPNLLRKWGPFGSASEWATARLNVIAREITAQELEEPFQESEAVISLVGRLEELSDVFCPSSASQSNNQSGVDQSPEPTFLVHPNISLDNILVDEVGVFTGLVDWDSVRTDTLSETLAPPSFLQDFHARIIEPPHIHYFNIDLDSYDDRTYYEHIKDWELTKLRLHWEKEIQWRWPEWKDLYRQTRAQRDYEAAIQNLDDRVLWKRVQGWVQKVERSELTPEKDWNLNLYRQTLRGRKLDEPFDIIGDRLIA